MARMSKVRVLVVAALSLSAVARAEKPSVAIAPVTGDRATDDLRSRVAKFLAERQPTKTRAQDHRSRHPGRVPA